MLKFLLIIFLFLFIVFRLGGFIIKVLGGGNSAQRKTTSGGRGKYTPRGGNVNVDYEPGKQRKKKDFDDGEYVDYEEVK